MSRQDVGPPLPLQYRLCATASLSRAALSSTAPTMSRSLPRRRRATVLTKKPTVLNSSPLSRSPRTPDQKFRPRAIFPAEGRDQSATAWLRAKRRPDWPALRDPQSWQA